MDAEAMNELKRRAEAATPGQWKMTGDGQLMANGKTLHCYAQLPALVMQAYWRNQADVPYIVAAQPQTTLSLIAHAERQQAAIVEARNALLALVETDGSILGRVGNALRALEAAS